ncbi:hypothetical protein EDB92DRAFT_244673 [Lactarius akahatsu]|uniref:Uncharacterized protein n=1 Tax=Lactarius akahatsu TaxID=416441 RepID=A0AAD4LLA3_9AGAM|nr:hypothetical protein EDB92DRAFT_244673 [Lactarius akahatsu]
MDTIFRVLFLHMRSFWRRARGLFVSIWFQRLHTSGSQKNALATRIHRPPTPIPPSPSGAASRIPPTVSMARTKVWACLRARKLKAQMRERRIAKKRAMYARIAARVTAVAVGKGKEGTKGEDEEEDEEEEVQEEDGHFDAPLPSEPRVDTCRLPLPLPLPHWGVSSTFGLELQLELGYDFPSPTDSCASSSGSTTTAPRTPVTPTTPTTTPLIPRSSIHFPGTRECMATESPRRPATAACGPRPPGPTRPRTFPHTLRKYHGALAAIAVIPHFFLSSVGRPPRIKPQRHAAALHDGWRSR